MVHGPVAADRLHVGGIERAMSAGEDRDRGAGVNGGERSHPGAREMEERARHTVRPVVVTRGDWEKDRLGLEEATEGDTDGPGAVVVPG